MLISLQNFKELVGSLTDGEERLGDFMKDCEQLACHLDMTDGVIDKSKLADPV